MGGPPYPPPASAQGGGTPPLPAYSNHVLLVDQTSENQHSCQCQTGGTPPHSESMTPLPPLSGVKGIPPTYPHPQPIESTQSSFAFPTSDGGLDNQSLGFLCKGGVPPPAMGGGGIPDRSERATPLPPLLGVKGGGPTSRSPRTRCRHGAQCSGSTARSVK